MQSPPSVIRRFDISHPWNLRPTQAPKGAVGEPYDNITRLFIIDNPMILTQTQAQLSSCPRG